MENFFWTIEIRWNRANKLITDTIFTIGEGAAFN